MDIYEKLVKYCRQKNPTMCWFDYPPAYIFSKELDFQDIKRSIQSLVNSDKTYGLYVNIPFCESRCIYCIYYSEIVKNKNEFDNYLDALEREIKLYKVNFKKRKLKHLYVGGGSPLLLDLNQLNRLFDIIYNNFSFTNDSLFITEGRPEDYSEEKLKILVKNNINRVTIGIQSLNTDVIKKMGRNYNMKTVEKSIKKIRDAGVKYINADIIVGLPGEGNKEHKKTISRLLKLGPDAISCYSMLYGKRVRIPQRQWVSDEKMDEYFGYFDRVFRKNNYMPIIDKGGFYNYFYIFLKNGDRAADNKLLFDNLNNNAYILGIGSGAMSYLPDVRYSITGVLPYIENIKKNINPEYFGMFSDKDDIMRQYIILQLYLYKQIKLKDFKKKYQIELIENYKEEISNLKNNKIIRVENNGKIVLVSKVNSHSSFLNSMLRYVFKKDYLEDLFKIAGIKN